MRKRLQVLIDGPELWDIRRIARAHHMTVAEWVRQALRAAWQRELPGDAAGKRAAVRAGALHAFPTGDIDTMLTEIGRGYSAAPTRRP